MYSVVKGAWLRALCKGVQFGLFFFYSKKLVRALAVRAQAVRAGLVHIHVAGCYNTLCL